MNRKLLEIKTEEKNMIGLYTDAAKIDFKTNYDDKAPVYESVFGESFYLIELLKAVYDWALLAGVLHDENIYHMPKSTFITSIVTILSF